MSPPSFPGTLDYEGTRRGPSVDHHTQSTATSWASEDPHLTFQALVDLGLNVWYPAEHDAFDHGAVVAGAHLVSEGFQAREVGLIHATKLNA